MPLTFDIEAPGRYTPRRFVPDDAALTGPEVVSRLYQSLIDRPIGSGDALTQF